MTTSCSAHAPRATSGLHTRRRSRLVGAHTERERDTHARAHRQRERERDTARNEWSAYTEAQQVGGEREKSVGAQR
jgi:hypothetical protein